MPDRFLDLTDGVAMLVTDLHGDRAAFDLYIDRFRTLHAQGEADRLILMGDLIHSDKSPAQDDSLRMVLDVIALRDELGPDAVIMLLGNHEMPHIYGVTLARGDIDYTPRFEHALGPYREPVIAFFEELPFYARTGAGVMLAHAGPALESISHVDKLRTFDHRAVLQRADETLAQTDDLNPLYDQYERAYGVPYGDLARHYLAAYSPDDPRYSHLLRSVIISSQDSDFSLLWDALFTQNERGLTDMAYTNGSRDFLAAFSEGAPAPQQVIVSGHIPVPVGGHAVINRFHFRLASAAHATPREAGNYLLLDCAQPVSSAMMLQARLGSVFDDDSGE